MILSDVQIVAMIVAVVAATRTQFPSIDGKLYVYIIAMLIGVGLCFLIQIESVWRLNIVHGLISGLTAAGGMQAFNYVGKKISITE
jgi:hypothetical protein